MGLVFSAYAITYCGETEFVRQRHVKNQALANEFGRSVRTTRAEIVGLPGLSMRIR